MMKLWRYNILLDLFDNQNARIVQTLPRDVQAKPTLVIPDVRLDPIPYSQFDQLVAGGDLLEVGRTVVKLENNKAGAIVTYTISQGGRGALQALPNFYRRATTRKVTP